jgi:hypothetical protein
LTRFNSGEKSVVPFGYVSEKTMSRFFFLASSPAPLAAAFATSPSSFNTAMVLRPERAARSRKPSGVSSTDEMTMIRVCRPFSHSDVVPAIGAMSSLRCFSVTSATASVMGEEYGPSTASTRSSAISFSYTPIAAFSSERSSRITNSIGRPSTPPCAFICFWQSW